ncbi:uncharacterized protein PAC_13232 [Phialocephala subalpina]|uniref:Uncharacterized protein n=1 Tax=Phialocephala subalpina TaxID=576137 RepID=A0A1L7XE75_9HELO|nr:uncharacterized protein PAC_13232 [Phialocephala subalpina]
MPYNTTAIPRRSEKEPTGTTQLPLSRVKKMMQVDFQATSTKMNSRATFLSLEPPLPSPNRHSHISLTMPYNTTAIPRRSEKEPTGTTQLPCESHPQPLCFYILTSGSIPSKENDASRSTNGESSIEAGQTTLDGKKPMMNGGGGMNGFASHGGQVVLDDEDDSNPNAQLEMEIRGAGARDRTSAGSAGAASGKQTSEDVEMS